MSVNKYRIKKGCGHTSLSNKVISGLSYNLSALGLYTYLSHLPQDWEFHKSHLRKNCGIGVNKLDKIIKILEQHGLISQHRIRNDLGQFIFNDMCIHSGNDFKEIKKEVETPKVDYKPTHTMKTIPMVPMGMDNSNYKYNILQNVINKQMTTVCFDKKNTDLFDNFWHIYPKKVAKKEAKKSWSKINSSDKLKIMEDVKKRKMNNWHKIEKNHIPNPASYLNGERWNDELIKPHLNKPYNSNRQEIRSTVKPFVADKEKGLRSKPPIKLRSLLENYLDK